MGFAARYVKTYSPPISKAIMGQVIACSGKTIFKEQDM
jgi:hypothetical protein